MNPDCPPIPHRLLLACVMYCAAALTAGKVQAVEYLKDVRPVLSTYCFKCHGPDSNARKAGLRLDLEESKRMQSDTGLLVVKEGKPEESELIRRIMSNDPDDIMPPPATKHPLTSEQKAILVEWVRSGAEFAEHWAWSQPVKPTNPGYQRHEWPKNALDGFILTSLEKAGLEPAPPADPYQLIRRVYLDLIGLPPDTGAVESFVANPSQAAYEALVDSLLASPRYGEKWARDWLDLARYSDTNGYEKDRERSIWPYRDWVIEALNEDMPFDRFTIEQIAGDMIPNAGYPQRIATGFHRNTMLNEEGGIDPLEYRFHAMVDRVNTTATTWLGLTMGCAQCHTHKYDPIQHDEYYRFMALLNNADEPTLDVPRPEMDQSKTQWLEKINDLKKGLEVRYPVSSDLADAGGSATIEEQRRASLDRDFRQWLNDFEGKVIDWTPVTPSAVEGSLPYLEIEADGSVFAGGDMSKRDTYTIRFADLPKNTTALRLETLADERLPAHGPGNVYYEGPIGDFWLSDIHAYQAGKEVKFSRASQSFASGSNTAESAIDDDLQSGWSVNGGQGKDHQAVFVLVNPLHQGGELTLEMVFERYYAAGLGRFRFSVTTQSDPPPALGIPLEVQNDWLSWKRLTRSENPDSPLFSDVSSRLKSYFLQTTPKLEAERKAMEALESKIPSPPTTLVFKERPEDHPRATYRHHRGEFLQPKEKVEPGVPAILLKDPSANPGNRMELALWLVSRDNPLTARVLVNRHWAAFFGTGLVKTLGDFGFQGDLPSHPQLLDWLAVELMDNGWSIKKLHKQIVMSMTYRQSAAASPRSWELDPSNRLLGRSSRFRLSAEVIRDTILEAAGLLTHKIGGPSVFPPQPAGVTTEGAYRAMKWEADTGSDRFRRSLYTFSKRTNPFAAYATFDAPSGDACVAARDRSNTPLQALTLLNDQIMVEAAQFAGRTAVQNDGPLKETLREMFQSFLSRPPSVEEEEWMKDFFLTQQSRMEEDKSEAEKRVGSFKAEQALSDQAAWTALARVLINLDETIMRN